MKTHQKKLDVCAMKRYSRKVKEEETLGNIYLLKNVLSFYLPSEITKGLIDIMLATCPNTPYNQIENALVR